MSKTSGTQKREAYQRPELVVFGSVRNLTGGSMGTFGDSMGTFMAMATSDRRCKENEVQIGTHPAGFGIYLFDYRAEFQHLHGAGRQFGVMADEVAPIVPDAVIVADDGYARVDYAKLGITRH